MAGKPPPFMKGKDNKNNRNNKNNKNNKNEPFGGKKAAPFNNRKPAKRDRS